MKLNDSVFIPAPREEVWQALNDIEVLRQCIPGCEEIKRISENEMEAIVTVKMGPVKATFKGKVSLSEIEPAFGYRISGEGKSMMGGANGGANVRLEDMPDGTRLNYDVDAQVTGKIASLAQRFIEPTARQLSAQFFNEFAQLTSAPQS